MQCDEFDVRLHKLLDRRRLPDCDPHLRHHAQVCPRCGEQLTATLRLLEGLDLLEVPPLRDDFALRVIQQVVAVSPARRARWTPLAIAVAATLLIGLLPGLGYLLRSRGSWDLHAPEHPSVRARSLMRHHPPPQTAPTPSMIPCGCSTAIPFWSCTPKRLASGTVSGSRSSPRICARSRPPSTPL